MAYIKGFIMGMGNVIGLRRKIHTASLIPDNVTHSAVNVTHSAVQVTHGLI